jgi:hypothetical protein
VLWSVGLCAESATCAAPGHPRMGTAKGASSRASRGGRARRHGRQRGFEAGVHAGLTSLHSVMVFTGTLAVSTASAVPPQDAICGWCVSATPLSTGN